MIRRLMVLVLVLWIGGFALFALSFGKPLEGVKSDAIVVPTGGAGRIDRGLALMRAHAARRMLITGVAPEVKPAELAAEYMESMALFRCCIDLGHEAVDTRSNADETAQWVRVHGYRTIRLVTSNWHMRRAALELRHALGAEVTVIEDPVPAHAEISLLFAEYNKYLVRRGALMIGLGG